MTHRILIVGFALVALAFALFVFVAPEWAHAATPTAPLGGSFTVNETTFDGNFSNANLSLHEALLIARDGTGATGLNRALTAGEKAQLTGCTINGSNFITGGCGAGITDTITLMVLPGITLSQYLPVIDDTAPTILSGGANLVHPVINALLIGSHNGLRISSSNNQVFNLTFQYAPQNDIYIDGDNNWVYNVQAWNAGSNGIYISGNNNTVEASSIGVDYWNPTNCVSDLLGNTNSGIYLAGGAQSNTITNSDIGCNGIDGIFAAGSATPGNHTMSNNRVGTDTHGTFFGNSNDGIYLGNDNNSVTGGTITHNSGNGISVTGDTNHIYGVVVQSNTGDGIQVSGSGSFNRIGCSADCFFGGVLMGNIVMGNDGSGVVITGTLAHDTYVVANRIGVNGGGGANGNAGNGILIYGAYSNYIGEGLTDAYLNWIGYNGLDNVRLDGSAFSNSIANNLIYNSGNSGVLITGGAHDNTIGGTASDGNDIYSNSADGVRIYSNSNTVDSNTIRSNTNGVFLLSSAATNVIGTSASVPNLINSNTADGISIAGTAHANTIGVNYIGTNPSFAHLGNLGNGITIYGSAYSNTIGTVTIGNLMSYNQMNGIVMSGASVRNNLMNSNHSESNVQNGLLLTNGTHDNIIHQPGEIATPNNFGANSLNGILISLGAHDNTIDVNIISGNAHNGIELTDSGTSNNLITHTAIFNNAYDAINERNSATQNSWSHLSTYSNGGMGIDKVAPGDTTNYVTGVFPTITSVTKNGGNVTVNGTASPSIFGGNTVWVELYSMNLNPIGFAEGKTYLGNSQTQLGTGYWTITYPASAPGCYVAFQTIVDGSGNSTSSENSPNSCRVFLPLTIR